MTTQVPVILGDAPDRRATLAVTIPSGAAVSVDVADVRGWEIVGIRMPATWTAAALGFSESDTAGGTYQPLYDDGGGSSPAECRYQFSAGKTFRLGGFLDPFRYLKLRSIDASTGADVNQAADRSIVLFLRLPR